MEIKNNITSMTRCNNIKYKAPKLYTRGLVEYYLWKDEFHDRYVQIISKRKGHDVSLDEEYYFFSIRQYNKGVFLGNVWGLNGNLKKQKIVSIDFLFKLKSVLQHYNQLNAKSKSEY
ncbi:hypothetical protein VXS03_07000 [Photobacterium sp. S4TG1]|uniref:hypothetical protein n=1 Tax=Photobacterium sp. S4TG1 TaxID=3114587 RepID=UPI002E19B58C|nr:hypothetical protein [Photobacterium sp. S4TG1]